jgi:anti-sigma28 factor (negative regulator of flagellin synthesis)
LNLRLKFLKIVPIKYIEVNFVQRIHMEYSVRMGGCFMEINKFTSAVGAYRKVGSDYKSAVKGSGKSASGSVKKVDTLELSSAARATIESAKSDAKRSADSGASPERIAALKAKIADGTYSVSSENVAAAILGG